MARHQTAPILPANGSHWRRVPAVLLWAILAHGASASAQNASLDISQYAHTAWTVRDGYFGAGVAAIMQSADGYLWLATRDALLRFDGVRAVAWEPPEGQSLPRGLTHALIARPDGTLLIGSHSGLAQWDGRRSS